MTLQRILVAGLFLLSLAFFLERGAYRGLHESRTGDFATIYAAARCWLHHEGPYDRAGLERELVQAGAPSVLIRDQLHQASLYPISAFPFVALLAFLPWSAANIIWCILSLACFAASIVALLQDLAVSKTGKWIAASACLFFSPTYVGVVNGNASVISISLAILSLDFAIHKRLWKSGVLFGVTLCIKPQIAICCFLALLLWRRRAAVVIGAVVAGIVWAVAILHASSSGQSWGWLVSWWQNVAHEGASGGLDDSRPGNPFASGFLNAQTLSYLVSGNALFAEGIVFALALVLAVLYFHFSQNEKNGPGRKWVDAAFFAALSLAITYHRYYDAQLLLAAIPTVVYLWQSSRVRTAALAGLCLLALAFPLQSTIDRIFGPAAGDDSPALVLLRRYKPFVVILLALVLCSSAILAMRTRNSLASSESQRD